MIEWLSNIIICGLIYDIFKLSFKLIANKIKSNKQD